MASNFVPVLAQYWQPLPMLVLGVPALLAGILSFHLQETSGKDLPQTMKEAHNIGAGQDNEAVDDDKERV